MLRECVEFRCLRTKKKAIKHEFPWFWFYGNAAVTIHTCIMYHVYLHQPRLTSYMVLVYCFATSVPLQDTVEILCGKKSGEKNLLFSSRYRSDTIVHRF
jgi:hypothetical protein